MATWSLVDYTSIFYLQIFTTSLQTQTMWCLDSKLLASGAYSAKQVALENYTNLCEILINRRIF